jgi:hypothetical protein
VQLSGFTRTRWCGLTGPQGIPRFYWVGWCYRSRIKVMLVNGLTGLKGSGLTVDLQEQMVHKGGEKGGDKVMQVSWFAVLLWFNRC